MVTNTIYDSNMCSICYEDYEANEINECLILKCGHLFHERCIEQWIANQQNCPLCKSKAIAPLSIENMTWDLLEGLAKGINFTARITALITPMLAIIAIKNFASQYLNWFSPNNEKDAYINEHGEDYFPNLRFVEYYPIIQAFGGIYTSCYIMGILYRRKCEQAYVAKKIDYMPPSE